MKKNIKSFEDLTPPLNAYIRSIGRQKVQMTNDKSPMTTSRKG